jgi:hypothetical protein
MTTRTASKRGRTVVVNDLMQKGYRYERTEAPGRNFDPRFTPDLTPREMLALGVFEGKYMTDCRKEFPKSWFAHAKLSPGHANNALNYFRVHASQSLSVWRAKGWINERHDPRGWFQWYCRYYSGRRLGPGTAPDGKGSEDDRQIKRWRAIARHIGQIKKHCRAGDRTCRPGQRQALLHWAYDARKM